MHIRVNAPAKINLTFDVTGDLPDGYHSIVSLFQAITLDDELSFDLQKGHGDEVEIEMTADFIGEPGQFPLGENNLIARAAREFQKKTGLLSNRLLRINVTKKIPIGAGLAGGSSNAAAVLVALNHLFSFPLSQSDLLQIATTLGADVSFLLAGGTQLGKGKGELLTPISVSEKISFVVLKPRQLSISTPTVFAAYDRLCKQGKEWKPKIEHDRAINFLVEGDLENAVKCFGNVFEPIVFDMHPSLALIKQRLLDFGCWSAQLTGSGPSIFAVVANLEMAHAVRRTFKEEETRGDCHWLREDGWEIDCFIAESKGEGVQIISELRH